VILKRQGLNVVGKILSDRGGLHMPRAFALKISGI